ncbi:YopX family protein [Paenibacillus macerans]|uniref:YopX family protein n=1 Tax=Paenibacillus macerans TaxID=44252 RepID=UPI00203ADF5C|nr:YopX family protein [Paenibacillus macerans]MCM3704028.1 YopX family protein [Paenibacillus macerans]
MREIKFRAKCIDESEYNGQLIYGFGVHNWDDDGVERAELYTPNGVLEVDPETVGQYTGLPDRNGKEIYEGDIYHQGDRNIRYVVVWRDTGLIGKQIGTRSYAGLQHWKDRIEVIGNRWDNPELLGEV